MRLRNEKIGIWVCKETGCPFTGCCVDDCPRDGINPINDAMRSEEGLRCPRCSRYMLKKMIDFDRYEIADFIQPYRWPLAILFCLLVAYPIYLLPNTSHTGITEYYQVALLLFAMFFCGSGYLWMFKNDPNDIPARLNNLYWVKRFFQGSIMVIGVAALITIDTL
jgi:peptidoglycan/LPS O-acetylase OafA/YrhL